MHAPGAKTMLQRPGRMTARADNFWVALVDVRAAC
jgi:hypothetical protein